MNTIALAMQKRILCFLFRLIVNFEEKPSDRLSSDVTNNYDCGDRLGRQF